MKMRLREIVLAGIIGVGAMYAGGCSRNNANNAVTETTIEVPATKQEKTIELPVVQQESTGEPKQTTGQETEFKLYPEKEVTQDLIIRTWLQDKIGKPETIEGKIQRVDKVEVPCAYYSDQNPSFPLEMNMLTVQSIGGKNIHLLYPWPAVFDLDYVKIEYFPVKSKSISYDDIIHISRGRWWGPALNGQDYIPRIPLEGIIGNFDNVKYERGGRDGTG